MAICQWPWIMTCFEKQLITNYRHKPKIGWAWKAAPKIEWASHLTKASSKSVTASWVQIMYFAAGQDPLDKYPITRLLNQFQISLFVKKLSLTSTTIFQDSNISGSNSIRDRCFCTEWLCSYCRKKKVERRNDYPKSFFVGRVAFIRE